MRNPFRRTAVDAGSGSFNDYKYNLMPNNTRVTMQLAGSDPHQDELARLQVAQELQAFIPKRTIEEERTDTPLPVRFLVDGRMSGVVGYAPRGLEPVVFEAIARMEQAGRSPRIPAEIVTTRAGLRVNLLMGETR